MVLPALLNLVLVKGPHALGGVLQCPALLGINSLQGRELPLPRHFQFRQRQCLELIKAGRIL